ncbi:MAG: dephospho-CoA kinase, partial [Lachnospiraceae bacterium]|nr:dephospho-CoA kinase [Lachnospiraceae bacterium]
LYEPLVRLLEEKTPENGAHGPLLLENGEIDKQEMAGRIFSDPLLLTRINELVHPAVNKYIRDEIGRERISGEKEFFILESALLIENGYDRILDSMWYIYCEESVRSMRLKASRGYSDEKIRSIMMRQVSEEVFRTHCDTVIDNTLDFDGPQGAAVQVDEAVARLREKFGAQQ